ncbi:MAG: hypothetical protein ACLTMP_11105 [Eggerthella lenta]
MLARRDALPEEVRARKSAAICARLEQVLAEALAGAEGAGRRRFRPRDVAPDATGGSAVPLWPCSRRCAVRWTRGIRRGGVRARLGRVLPCMVREGLQRAVAGGGRAGAAKRRSPVPSEPRAGDVPRMPSGSRAAGGRRTAGGGGNRRHERVAPDAILNGAQQLDAAGGVSGAPLRCLACEALERDGFQTVDPGARRRGGAAGAFTMPDGA